MHATEPTTARAADALPLSIHCYIVGMSPEMIIGLAAAGWLATTWMAYRWGLHSQKIQREHAANAAVKQRRREFLSFMAKTISEVQHNERNHAPGDWWNQMKPRLHEQAEIIKTDLEGESRTEFVRLFELAISDAPQHDQRLVALKTYVENLDVKR